MLNGTQTRKYTSGQPFDEDYQFWLAGYWEDFSGSYSLPEAQDNSLSTTNTHYGNPLNAEARLNPHYRWSYADRTSTFSGATVYGGGKVTNDIKELHNLSMAEWLTVDVTRLDKGRAYSAKINNEFLDSHTHSNRYKLGGKGELDNYILMSTSFMSGGKYFINNGDTDPSFMREGMTAGYRFHQSAGISSANSQTYNTNIAGTTVSSYYDYSALFNDSGEDATIFHTASAVTTGSFTIDTTPSNILTISDWDANQQDAHILGAEIKSPSRTPFLAIRHTMPATHRINGDVDPVGADGNWRYTGNKRELEHFRIGDIVQIGKHDEFGVIQAIDLTNNKITKLYSLSRNELLDVSKFKSTNGEYIGGGASEGNVDIRKWFEPVMTFDGDLNCVGNGDTFHFRFCPLNIKDNGLPDSDRISHYIIRVGFDSSRLDMTSRGNRYTPANTDHNPSHCISAIQFELQPHPTSESQKIMKDINQVRVSALDSNISTVHKQSFIDLDSTSTVTTPNYSNEWQQWLDVDVVMDFTNQRYKVYVDGYEGGTFNFETKPSGGNWSATDLYGYHIDHASLQKDGTFTPDNGTNEYGLTAGKWWGPKSERTGTMWTLIDRVGLINEITNPVRNSPNTISAGSDMSINEVAFTAGINRASNMQIKILDDNNERQIQDIFQDSPSEWMLLFFKNNIDSPSWVGFLEQVTIKQNAKQNTREIKITSRDAISRLDSIMPYWEVGQNEKTLSTEYTYREEEALMISDNFYMGARALLRGQQSIGMDHQTRALHPQASTTEIGAISGYYSARYDQRTRLFSANPIQMYVGQDTFGPSAEPDVYNTAPTAIDSDKNIWRMWNTRKIIGFSDGRSHGTSYIIAHCIEHGLEVNDEFKIYDEYGGNAFTRTGDGKNGLDIVVKKIIDNHHFCFEYKNTVGAIFGHLKDETGHFYSVVTRHPDDLGLGFNFGSSSPYAYTGWTQGNFVETSARGLMPVGQHHSDTLGKITAIDGRQWSAYYTRHDFYEKDHGVGALQAASAVTWDQFTDSVSPDSIIHNTWGKDFSTALDTHGTESATDWRGYSQYSFKPAGIIPLKNSSIKYINDPHGLVTVGPMFNFYDGRQLPSADDQYNYRFALEYIGTIGSTHRSQILSIVDYMKKFRKTEFGFSSISGNYWLGNEDTELSMVVRGNDIDQQDPSQLPLLNVNESWSTSVHHMKSASKAFMRPNSVEYKVTALSGTGNEIELTIGTGGIVDLLPATGWGTVGPGGSAQGFIRWRGVDVANDKLTGCTILQEGTSTIQQLINGGSSNSFRTFLFPVISNCQAIFTPPSGRESDSRYRVAHASYIHDIASSLWFRMVFGIIEPDAHGLHGPGKNVLARKGNRITTIHGSGTSTDVGWRFQHFEYDDISPYTTQYSEYFTLTAPYTVGTSTTLTLSNATVPLIDENFKDRRYIDKGSTEYDIGTDPTISIPSRANAHSSKRFMNNGGLIFEIDNEDGTVDVGVARSAVMNTCLDKSDDDYTHWEIVAMSQTEILNIIDPNTGEWVMSSEGANTISPGPITITAAQNASQYLTTNKTRFDTVKRKDPDWFHSGSDSAVSGSRMFQSISVGDVIFLGNTQGSVSQPVTTSVDAHYNVENPYGEDRDLVSYRWYRVLEKAADHSTITIFPAEYAYCDHTITSNRHPVAMGQTTENAVSGGFQGWKWKLVKGTGSPVDNPGLTGGATQNGPTICKLYAGDVQMNGVKFLKNSHAIGAKGRFRKIKNNFNHIWLNWADMRNDGSADADGGGRQTNWGLLYPLEEQYKVSVVFSETQEDIAELAIGTDIDMWDLTNLDPYSGSAWSGNYSNTMTNMTYLHNWESKAGAPMAIDASKFFNLNTMTNNGRIGQSSGGVKTIGEYDFSVAGEAKLMDNYWWQAGPHPYTAKYRHPYDPNFQFYVRYESRLVEDLDKKPLMVLDSSKNYEGSYFPDLKGTGIMEFKADSDNLDIFTYRMGGCFVSQYDESISSNAVRLYINLGTNKVDYSNVSVQDPMGESMALTTLNNNISESPSNKEHAIHGTWSSLMSLSAMLSMEGYVKSPECGSFYEHDKIRLLFQTHGVKSWLAGSDICTSYDIQNVPITYDMPTDSFGSVVDVRASTTFKALMSIQQASGQGVNGNYNAFNYMVGRNGKFEFRPSYDSGEALDRNLLRESETKTQARAQFTHVRVFYNSGESFVDYPTPILDGSQIKFRIVNSPNTRTSASAEALALKELESTKDKNVQVKAELIGGTDSRSPMFDGGLYGYISTPLIQCLSDLGSAANWGAFDPHGNMTGQIIGGRQNAMDGNLMATNANLIGAQRGMEYIQAGNGYHGGGGCNTYDTHATQWYGQYTPYGIHCIEKAVQIVHIPRNTPKVSSGSGQKLRMFITHKSNTANDAVFRLWLVDSHFDSQRRQGYTGNNPLTSSKISYLDITKNGFHEVPFPTSYGATSGAKMIVSFNKEYCVDLLKYRSNNTNTSKSNKGNRVTTIPSTDVSVLDLTTGSSVNEASAFPLGLSLYHRPAGSEDARGRQGPVWQLRPRALYYAPTVEIVDDMVWRPGTVVSYNDSHLNINQDLTLVEIGWTLKERDSDKVSLTLMKDESQFRLPRGLGGGGGGSDTPPATGNPPNNGGGGLPGGGIGDIPYLPGDDIGWAPGWGGLKPPSKGGIGTGHSVTEKTSKQNRLSNISGAPAQESLGGRMTGGKVSLSKMSGGAMNTMKGKADLSSENEEGGLLGITRNRGSVKNNIKTTSKEAIGQSKTTSSGSAIIGADGFILPGVSALLESGAPVQSDYHEGSVTITVPPSVVNERIKVTANIKAPLTGGNTTYTLFATLECIESGHKQSKVINITYSDTAQRVTLFSIRKVKGSSVLGNRIKITIGRVPGGGLMASADGSDNAPYSSLTIKGIEVSFNEQAQNKELGKTSTTRKLESKDRTKGWMSGTDNAWKSKTSDATFDSSGNVSYDSRGKSGSNAIKKDEEDSLT